VDSRSNRKDSAMTEHMTMLDSLETPKLVRDMLARLGKCSPATLERAKREYKLSYYYGGLVIAGLDTPGGLAVVFSGSANEVAAAIKPLPRNQVEQLIFSTPDPIEVHIANLPQVECALS
jgi:hypothetical protein